MTQAQQTRFRELMDKMARNYDFCEDFTHEDYNEYLDLAAIEQKEYREANEQPLTEFFNKNIKGRKWEDINPHDWDTYSDWHKDVFGYRPKSLVCVGC